MDKSTLELLLKYINDNKGWTYIGNKQPLIAVQDLVNYIKMLADD